MPNYKEMAIFYLEQASNKLTIAETIYSLDAFVKHSFIKNNIEDIFNELRMIIYNFIKALIEGYPVDELLISEFEKN